MPVGAALAGIVPAGKSVKCGKCTTVFLVPAKQTKLETPRTTALTKGPLPARPAPPGPVMHLDCPGCKTALKLTGKMPVGRPLKCPKCTKPLRLLPKRPAAKTKLAAAAARKTKLPAGPARKTKVAAGPARPTRLAAGPARKTKMAAGPAKKTLLAEPAPAAAPATAQPAVKLQPETRPQTAPPRLWKKAVKGGLYLALAGVLGALGVVGVGLFGRGPLAPRGEIPGSAWQEFAPPDGHCRVQMPGEPKQLKGSPKGIGGADAHIFVVSWKEDAVFSLSFWGTQAAERKKDPLKELGDIVEDRLRDTLDGIVIRRTSISRGGHSGREWVIEPARGGTLIARLYQVKRPNRGPVLRPDGGWRPQQVRHRQCREVL